MLFETFLHQILLPYWHEDVALWGFLSWVLFRVLGRLRLNGSFIAIPFFTFVTMMTVKAIGNIHYADMLDLPAGMVSFKSLYLSSSALIFCAVLFYDRSRIWSGIRKAVYVAISIFLLAWFF